MRISRKAGALAVGMAAGVGLVVPLALPAAAGPPAHVACAKETSPPLAQSGGKVKSTLALCTPAALKAGGSSVSAVKPGQTAGTLTNTITWKNGKGKTVAIVKFAKAATKGKCKAPYDSRIKITGSVKSSSGAAAAIIKKGEPLSAFICAITKGAKQGQTTLEPGTKFKL